MRQLEEEVGSTSCDEDASINKLSPPQQINRSRLASVKPSTGICIWVNERTTDDRKSDSLSRQ